MSIATPKKRAANRANAAKSTGPRTPEGKQRSGRNAVTHGLFCSAAVLPGEDPAELERLRRGMMGRLRPRDELERMLADRAVSEAWRLRRAVAYEARVIASKTIEEQAERQRYRARYADKPPLHAGQIIRGLLSADVLTKLSRYEQRIERSMYRAMTELRRLQAESLPEGEWLDTEADEADEPAGARDDGDPMRKTKPDAENSKNVEPPVEEEEEEEDYEDEDEDEEEEDERARKTKPDAENSKNVEPPAEEEDDEEGYEDEDEGTDEEEDERPRRTKPRTDNSQNPAPPPEKDEEEEDYEDEEEDEDEDDGGPSATEKDALPRETKPNAENSGFFPAVPRPEPEAPAPAPQARAVFIKQTRDRVYGRRRR